MDERYHDTEQPKLHAQIHRFHHQKLPLPCFFIFCHIGEHMASPKEKSHHSRVRQARKKRLMDDINKSVSIGQHESLNYDGKQSDDRLGAVSKIMPFFVQFIEHFHMPCYRQRKCHRDVCNCSQQHFHSSTLELPHY